MAGEGEQIVNAWPLRFAVGGREWAIRQPRCEERDDARAVYRAYEALWRGRPEIKALKDLRASEEEVAVFDAALDAARVMLAQAEHPAHREALKRRIAGLERQKRTWTQADEVVTERAALARDRWLTVRLLLEPDGAGGWRPVFDPQDPAHADRWETFDDAVRDAARPALWAALRLAEDARFFSATRSAPA